ncbi:MAG: hypothetical protein RBR71_04360 [Gudongella sp.]|nr:hypothetical protein [Gudongella sp.]
MNTRQEIIQWLLEGDISIQYQTKRDLLHVKEDSIVELRARIATEGWGYSILQKQNENGHWGISFYQPKWVCTHYTLLDLRCLCCPNTDGINIAINIIADENKAEDGGINTSRGIKESDVCINGMFLNYACFYNLKEEKLKSVIDFIISQQLHDGGFNCLLNRSGATHSSLHSTISCLEGIQEYIKNGYTYRIDELKSIEKASQEFILVHRLYKSDKTGEIIHKSFTMLSYPSRWRYDILRSLSYFQQAKVPYDDRMEDALQLLLSKQRRDSRWPVQAKHAGKVHIDMEKTGTASRWNTLRAIKVLDYYK